MDYVKELLERHPCLSGCREAFAYSISALVDCYENGGKVLVCMAVEEHFFSD